MVDSRYEATGPQGCRRSRFARQRARNALALLHHSRYPRRNVSPRHSHRWQFLRLTTGVVLNALLVLSLPIEILASESKDSSAAQCNLNDLFLRRGGEAHL